MMTTKEERKEWMNHMEDAPELYPKMIGLIQDIEELEAKLEIAKEALEHYAFNYVVVGEARVAKEALEKIEEEKK